MPEIKTIKLPLPYKMGRVNCYLVLNTSGYFLIDTGHSSSRARLEGELLQSGCQPGNLKLILITHGDFDHSGNAAYISQKFKAKIAMHQGDAGMVELGDIFFNRKKRNFIFKTIAALLFGFKKAERFKADLFLDDNEDLTKYGWQAKVFSFPGHSRGSMGILTAEGDFFCGDLLTGGKPAVNSIIDDTMAMNKSIEKLKNLNIKMVYPGHGRRFLLEEFWKTY